MPAALPDAWPAAASYRYLDHAGPAGLAWEWLRRDPAYQAVAGTSAVAHGDVTLLEPAPADCTGRWGCLAMPDAGLGWMEAPVLWSAAVDASVLQVVALAVMDLQTEPFDHIGSAVRATVVRGDQREHVLLGSGAGAIRLDVAGGSLLEGPVSLMHDLSGVVDLEPTLAALRRFLNFRRTGHLTVVPPASQRLRRQVLALRVHDALVAGASIRDVGVMLFGLDRIREEWAGEALKSQCRRLIAMARDMATGGYRELLG
ncbi:DNA -binding domain-containing protein [Sphingobium chungangianum]